MSNLFKQTDFERVKKLHQRTQLLGELSKNFGSMSQMLSPSTAFGKGKYESQTGCDELPVDEDKLILPPI